MPYTFHRCEFSALDLISLLFQFFQKFFVTARLVRKDAVNHTAQLIAVAFFWRVKYTLLPFPIGLLLNDGQLVFQANQVAQPLHCQRRKEKIPELSGAIQCRGVKNHMVVDVLSVRHYKGVLALGKTHGKFVAHLF